MRLKDSRSRKTFSKLVDSVKELEPLKKLKDHHLPTYEHSYRVALLAIDLGYEPGLNEEEIRIAGLGGLLHDLGKIHVPVAILDKTSCLDDEEVHVMKHHPRRGFIELKGREYSDIRRVIVAHHEFKRHPYPRKGTDRRNNKRDSERRRNDIRKLGEIVAAADIYDALASRRSYKEPLNKDEIERLMREQFTGNPRLIDDVMRRR